LLFGFGLSLPEKLIVAILELRRQHVVPYYTQREMDAHVFWLNTGILTGQLLVALIVGCIVAIVAKEREMVATLTLSFVFFALNCVLVQDCEILARSYPPTSSPTQKSCGHNLDCDGRNSGYRGRACRAGTLAVKHVIPGRRSLAGRPVRFLGPPVTNSPRLGVRVEFRCLCWRAPSPAVDRQSMPRVAAAIARARRRGDVPDDSLCH
jgi:hypothetical protein